MFRATGDPGHLEEAHRLLRDSLDRAPKECRTAMVANIVLHREITRAWEEQVWEE